MMSSDQRSSLCHPTNLLLLLIIQFFQGHQLNFTTSPVLPEVVDTLNKNKRSRARIPCVSADQSVYCELPLRKCCAPSRHSGDSSLSPNEPRSSLTMMSADSGADHCRMSQEMTVTRSPQNSAFMFCKLYTHNGTPTTTYTRHVRQTTHRHTPGCIQNICVFAGLSKTIYVHCTCLSRTV